MAISNPFGELAQQTLAQSPPVQPMQVAQMFQHQMQQQQRQRQQMQQQQRQMAERKAAADEEFAFKAMETVAGAKADVAPLMVDLLRPLAQRRGIALDFSSAILASNATEASALDVATRKQEYELTKIQQKADFELEKQKQDHELRMQEMIGQQEAITARAEARQEGETERSVRSEEGKIIAAQQKGDLKKLDRGQIRSYESFAENLQREANRQAAIAMKAGTEEPSSVQDLRSRASSMYDIISNGWNQQGFSQSEIEQLDGLKRIALGAPTFDMSQLLPPQQLPGGGMPQMPPQGMTPPSRLDASAIMGGQMPMAPQGPGAPQMMPPPRLPTNNTNRIRWDQLR